MINRRTRIAGLAAVLLLAGMTLANPALDVPASAELKLRVAAFDPLDGLPSLPHALRIDEEPAAGYFVVQLDRKIAPIALKKLERSGAELLHYVPDQAYLVRVPAGRMAAIRALPEVRWAGAFQPGWKLSPEIGRRTFEDPSRRAGGLFYVMVDLHPGEQPQAAAERIAATGAEVIQTVGYSSVRQVKVRADLQQLHAIAAIDAVAWIEELGELTPRNNTTRWVVQSNVSGNTSVWDRGLHGEGQIIGHIDGRIDMDVCYFQDPANNTPGPNHRKVVAYRSSSGTGANSHGTHTAGTAAGNREPVNGQTTGNGLAFMAKIAHANSSDISGSGASSSNLYTYLSLAHGDGARMHTNSWGDDGTTSYTTWSRDIDLFSYDFEDSLVLFAVTNTGSLKTPENAKNVLAVGASVNGTGANSFCSGGGGPTNDGRRKPEIFAPGCSIQSALNNGGCGTGSLTGTSMACPAVTAAGSLVRQYFAEGWYPSGTPQPTDTLVPSAALVKATLLNSAVDMTNISGFPSNQEGWGRVLLENALYFDGDLRRLSMLADVRNADGLTTGENAAYPLQVGGSNEPLKITLVFTEPAAALFANPATVNDLDLEALSPSGVVYRGNAFAGGTSVPNGVADPVNNVEMILVNNPEPGEWIVTIEGESVNQGTQGYGVVATGLTAPGAGGFVRYATHAIQDTPPLGNGDGRADPGETVTVPVSLRNLLVDPAAAVTAELTTGMPGIVQVTGADAAFPDIGGSLVVESLPPHHRFTVAPDAPCGTTVPLEVRASFAGGTSDSGFDIDIGRPLREYPALTTPNPIPVEGGVNSTLTVDEANVVDEIRVAVNIAHQDIGDLTLRLSSPQGTQVALHLRGNGGEANLSGVYGVDLTASGPGTLADFVGEQAQGQWLLRIQDRLASATPAGTLIDWSVIVNPADGPVCAPLDCAGDPVPAAVEPSLFVELENASDLRFTWPAVAGASSYRVWTSEDPQFATESLRVGTGSTTVLDPGGAGGPVLEYFVVRAVNSCEWEGP